MRALVTGGAGFIGSHIVDALVARGDEAVVLDNLDPRVHGAVAPDLPAGVRFIRGDVRDAALLDRALQDRPDVVFHAAAMVGMGTQAGDEETFVDVNVNGTLRLLAALAGRARPPRLVLASTMSVYGEGAYDCAPCGRPREARRNPASLDRGHWEPECPSCGNDLTPRAVNENHPQRPETVYAISKAAQEALALRVGRTLGVPVVALRYHNAYGPRMPRDTPYAGVASLFKSRLLSGRPPLVHEDGRQLRDFVHVRDVAAASLLAGDAPDAACAFEAFNIGAGQPRTIQELADGLARELAAHLRPEFAGGYRPGDPRHIFASIEKARRRLGFRPRVAWTESLTEFARAPTRAAPPPAAMP